MWMDILDYVYISHPCYSHSLWYNYKPYKEAGKMYQRVNTGVQKYVRGARIHRRIVFPVPVSVVSHLRLRWTCAGNKKLLYMGAGGN